MRSNDGLALSGVFAALREHGGGGLQGRGYGVDRRGGLRSAGEGAHEEVLQLARAREQNLALVGEVPDERWLPTHGPLGDLRHRGLLEPALAVQFQCRSLEPTARIWLPPAHPPLLSAGTRLHGA